MGGYAFAYYDNQKDPTCGSKSCVEMTSLCTSGSVVAQNPPSYSCYGAGIGINLNQMQGSMAMGDYAVPMSSTGVHYAVSSLPNITGGGLRVIITAGGTDYCAQVNSAMGEVMWSQFNSKCYDSPPDGMTLSGPPQMATQLKFQVASGTAAGTFDFCVTEVSF
jgi:hypothetical protein